MRQIYQSLHFSINKKQEQWLTFFVHASVWIMVFLVFYLFAIHQDENLPAFIGILYSYGITLFYLNYFLLTPHFLLQKKYLAFIVSVVAIILFSFFVVDPPINNLAIDDFSKHPPREFHEMASFGKMPMPDANKPIPHHPQGMFFLISSFLIFSSSIRIFQKLKSEEIINQQYQHEKLNAELMMLRQQVNPHFLFNSLNNILSLANRKSDQTSEAIVKLSSILRHMLSENPSKGIPITNETELINNYIDLQKLWMKNMITVDFQTENITGAHLIEPFILNPLVENAFKYGTLAGIESSIQIKIQMQGDWLHFKASNPVIREKLNEVSHLGIGVNNVIRRLELCYPGNYTIATVQKENNYQVNLSIKLRKNELYCN